MLQAWSCILVPGSTGAFSGAEGSPLGILTLPEGQVWIQPRAMAISYPRWWPGGIPDSPETAGMGHPYWSPGLALLSLAPPRPVGLSVPTPRMLMGFSFCWFKASKGSSSFSSWWFHSRSLSQALAHP